MRAVVFERPDGKPESTVITDVPMPVPGPGEALVRIAFAGLNFADLMMRSGVYPHPKGYPLVAGLEMSGEIEALGAGVQGFEVGQRVAAFSEEAGAFADYCVVPAERLIALPKAISLQTGAAFCIQTMTAWSLLHIVSETKPGDTLLIHAIGGGVGLQLTQLAKAAGARVIGTVGTPGKEAAALAYGADRVILRSEADFVAACIDATGGKGVDKVVDSTGASILDKSFEAIRPLGHVVSYGEAEGKPFDTLWDQLVRKSLTFTRLHVGHLDYSSDAWLTAVQSVTGMITAGTLEVPVKGTFRMEDVSEMFATLASRQTAGKLILKIG
ncbi:MAG: zinc-binding dehydrogenase [Pseudomonadota bacterium]